MSGIGRHLRYALDGASLFELHLSVELGVGLAHLTGRKLAFESRRDVALRQGGVSERDYFAMIGDLPVPILPPAEGSEAAMGDAGGARTADLNLANSVFVDRVIAADREALTDFAGGRTIFSDSDEDVLRLLGPNLGYYSRLFHAPRPSLHSVIGRIAPRAPFAALAQQIARSLGRFNGARILVGDMHKLAPYRGYDYAREILRNLADTLSGDELLAISTDEPDNAEFFAPIVSHFTQHVFVETLIAGDFGRGFAELPAAGDAALAWIAHLVLRNAQEFVGTPGDAFSGLTQRHVAIAQAKRDLFSESRPFKFTYPGAATIDVPFESGLYLETRPGRFTWNRLEWPLGDEMLSRYREWPEAIAVSGNADVGRASVPAAQEKAASAAPPRPFTMSTTFRSAYVPQQLLAGDPAAQRQAIERAMQAVACDLMFGADRADLVRRVEALGAPAADAKRIIDSAYNDPLIANGRAMAAVLRKRDWLLASAERQRLLWPPAATIERRGRIGADEFLERYYSQGRPVILTGEMASWPAMRWTRAGLSAAAGEIEVVCRSGAERSRAGAAGASGRMSFDRFIEIASASSVEDAPYLLADERLHNPELARRLRPDHGSLGAILDTAAALSGGMLWIGASNALTPLHHDLVNSIVAQIAGRNRFKIIAAGEVARLHNHLHVLSEIEDLDSIGADIARNRRLAAAHVYDVTLAPGEILYLPLAWWYQVRSEGFGISATYTHFKWPNDFYRTYPTG